MADSTEYATVSGRSSLRGATRRLMEDQSPRVGVPRISTVRGCGPAGLLAKEPAGLFPPIPADFSSITWSCDKTKMPSTGQWGRVQGDFS